MIYKKEANFPYPVLTNNSNCYEENNFSLDVELNENSTEYIFKINYDLSSEFLNNLISSEDAEIILIIQSKDNKFYTLKSNGESVHIPKSRISLSKRTSLQLLVKANKEISCEKNNELNDFYNNIKEDLVIQKNSVLAFSDVVIFDGSLKKPFELFEKKLDSNLKSDIKIDLDSETIIISYRNEELQFNDMRNSTTMNNHYIYMGLQKALFRFIKEHGGSEETVYIDEIELPTNGLDMKLYNLMKSKSISEVNMDNIDEVIYKISDKIIEKFTAAIKRLQRDGD